MRMIPLALPKERESEADACCKAVICGSVSPAKPSDPTRIQSRRVIPLQSFFGPPRMLSMGVRTRAKSLIIVADAAAKRKTNGCFAYIAIVSLRRLAFRQPFVRACLLGLPLVADSQCLLRCDWSYRWSGAWLGLVF